MIYCAGLELHALSSPMGTRYALDVVWSHSQPLENEATEVGGSVDSQSSCSIATFVSTSLTKPTKPQLSGVFMAILNMSPTS